MRDATAGVTGDSITTVVNVSRQLRLKRAAMAAHRSQIGADSPFLRLPAPLFALAFGKEWYVRTDTAARGEKSLFDERARGSCPSSMPSPTSCG